ncbi:hypothetical protein L1999_22675 [Neobacillus drentensis]|uniref:hypothetical protein n=1 Tax=Neobacillus drentensis TaxID=220684 RepID=UPI001F2CB397|nr:hypothetical protein [Neobacillus drentensis]ULT55866.1 hypothetical protein L1999_22675 [Neobacillus drentensis]
MIEKLLEHSRDSIALVTISLALILICIFIWTKLLRKDVLKVIGILIVLGLSLFANDATSYFLAILVLATLVTNLNFLQNIAAIIRNSDAYFNFLTRSQEEVQTYINNEYKNDEEAIKADKSQENEALSDEQINQTLDNYNLNPMEFVYIAEEQTFKFLEKKYSQFISKYVKISGNNKTVEIDGIIPIDRETVVLEIKISRHGYYPMKYILESIQNKVNDIKEISKQLNKNVELRFIFVGKINQKFKDSVLSLEPGRDFMAQGIDVKFEFYSFEDIDLKEVPGC